MQCWDAQAWQSVKKKYNWLEIKEDALGCILCSEVSSAPFLRGNGQHDGRWSEFKVVPAQSCRDETSRKLCLGKKIFRHKNSKSHLTAIKTKKESERNTMENIASQMVSSQLETTTNVMRIAYYVAKRNLPTTEFAFLTSDLCQSINANVGNSQHDRSTGVKMINHVAKNSRIDLVHQIIEENQKFSVLIDESTSRANKSLLIIYIRATLGGTIQNIFLDLVEVGKTAEMILKTLINTLRKNGFSKEILQKNWIALGSDGATVLTGRKSGLGALLKKEYPNVIQIHCINHRLELAVNDVVARNKELESLRKLFDKIYAHFSRSSERVKKLEEICKKREKQFLKPQKILSTRWTPSTASALNVLWRNYEAFAEYFEDEFIDDEDFDILQSDTFVYNLAVLKDAIEIISKLSLELQKRDININSAHQSTQSAISILTNLIDNEGDAESSCSLSVTKKKFRGVLLRKSAGRIDKQKFLADIISAVKERSTGLIASKGCDKELSKFNEIIEDTGVIFNNSGSEQNLSNIRRFCKNVGIEESSHFCFNYMNFLKTHDKQFMEEIRNVARTLPISNAECERGFSVMNLIISKLRSKLKTSNVANFMFISINGPPQNKFNAEKFAKSWLLKHRAANDPKNKKIKKGEIQEQKPTWDFF